MQQSSINLTKCCKIYKQKLSVKSWALINADNEIKMIIKNTNKPIQTTLKYQELQEFGSW